MAPRMAVAPPNKGSQAEANGCASWLGSILACYPGSAATSAAVGRGLTPNPLGGGRESDISLFEFLSVGIAIVVSFGVVRLLDGAHYAAKPGQLYWPHLVWVALKLLEGGPASNLGRSGFTTRPHHPARLGNLAYGVSHCPVSFFVRLGIWLAMICSGC